MGENPSQCPFMSHGCFFLTVTNFDAIFFVYGKVSVFLYIQLTKNDLNNQQIFEIVLRMAKNARSVTCHTAKVTCS